MPKVPDALTEATRHFTGRRWVFEKLDHWLAGGTERRLLIVGEPGTGKSTLAARLVEFTNGEQSDWPHLGRGWLAAAHFCRARVDQTLDPRRVFEQLALQLAERYPPFADALVVGREEVGVTVSVRGTATVGSAAAGVSVAGVQIGSLNLAGLAAREVFDRFLRRPLEAVCTELDQPVVVLIDSLDESLSYGGKQTLADVLRAATDDLQELPAQVRLLFTSRPDPRAIDGMADTTIDLIADAPPDDHDVRNYAVRRLELTALGYDVRAIVAERIATEGQGNFLYARYVLDDLIAHPERLSDPAALELPTDLADHYREFLRRELAASRQRWDERYQPVLGALAVARGDGVTRLQLAGALELRRSDIDAVLRVVGGYLSQPAASGRLRLYHQSFRDFLTAEGEFHVYPGEASDQLATYLLAEHEGNWLGCDDPYAVAFTPSHLIEALLHAQSRRDHGRLATSLCELLTDLGYLTARVRLERGSIIGLEHECAQGAVAAPDHVAATLASYADSLRRESHVLIGRPEDLFVQLVNRLPEAAVQGEARPSAPWLRALHPPPHERALRQTLSFHTTTAPAVAVTPDGRRAASVSWDRMIALWDVPEGRLVRRWEASTEMLEDVALSPDATQVISRDFEKRVVLWDATTGQQLRVWTGAAMAVTPDWSALLLARVDGSVAMLAVPDGAVLREWDTGAHITALEVTTDGRHAVAGGRPALVWIWPLDRLYDPVTLEAPLAEAETDRAWLLRDEGVAALALSEDGAVLTAGGRNGALWAWRLDERRLLWHRPADEAVNAIAVTSRQGLVLAGGVAGTIGVYELAGGEAVTRLRGHTGQVMHLALTADGATLLSAGGEGAVRVWDVGVARSGPATRGHAAEVTALALSGDARLAASGAADGSLMVWATETGGVVASTATAHAGRVGGLVFMDDGRLVSAGGDSVGVWDPDGLGSLAAIQVPIGDEWSAGLRSLARLSEGRVLAGLEDGRLVAVDLALRNVAVLGAASDSAVVALAVTRDGTAAFAGCADGSVFRWSPAGSATAERLGAVLEARTLVLTPDERYVVVGGLDGLITMFALARPQDLAELRGHVNYVDALAFTEDGALLIAGGWDATLRIWDPRSQEELGRYTWELPLSRALTTRYAGRDLVVVGDRQGELLFLTVERR